MKLTEYDIIQNEAVGAHALLEFIRKYYEHHPSKKFPEIIYCMPVLPIVFNRRSRELMAQKQFKEGSLYRTIYECRDIYAGLQERMEEMGGKTLSSLNILLAAGLLDYDNQNSQLIIISSGSPLKRALMSKDYKDIIDTSRRLGAWLSQLSHTQLTNYFNIIF